MHPSAPATSGFRGGLQRAFRAPGGQLSFLLPLESEPTAFRSHFAPAPEAPGDQSSQPGMTSDAYPIMGYIFYVSTS